MSPDTVQIGSLLISKSVLDVVFPLIGTLIGGLITYLTTKSIDDLRYKREKQDKLKEETRNALMIALAWIGPIERAWIKASALVSAYGSRAVTEDQFRHDYPNILAILGDKDPPAHLLVFLPKEAYPQLNEIRMTFNDLRVQSLSGQNTMELVDSASDLKKKIQELKNLLEAEYLRTFE